MEHSARQYKVNQLTADNSTVARRNCYGVLADNNKLRTRTAHGLTLILKSLPENEGESSLSQRDFYFPSPAGFLSLVLGGFNSCWKNSCRVLSNKMSWVFANMA